MVKNDQNNFSKHNLSLNFYCDELIKKKKKPLRCKRVTFCLDNPFLHSILFPFFIFFNFLNHSNYSIPFYFFSIIFFNFPNSYTISLNLNHLYHLKICKVKPFSKSFFKLFSKSNHLKL